MVEIYKMEVCLDKKYKYQGTHPLAELHHYENLLQERGLIEVAIIDITETDEHIKLRIREA